MTAELVSHLIFKKQEQNKKQFFILFYSRSSILRKNHVLVQKSQVIQTKTVLITIEKQRTSYDFAKKAKELCHRLL